jgi:23S rRNA pseudouridine2605 synthase
MAPPDPISSPISKSQELGIEIHSGRNRIVRRMFEALGYQVETLDRVMFAGLTKKMSRVASGVILQSRR